MDQWKISDRDDLEARLAELSERATDELVPQALANWRPTVAFTGKSGSPRSRCVTG
jgi:hypothetical protein